MELPVEVHRRDVERVPDEPSPAVGGRESVVVFEDDRRLLVQEPPPAELAIVDLPVVAEEIGRLRIGQPGVDLVARFVHVPAQEVARTTGQRGRSHRRQSDPAAFD